MNHAAQLKLIELETQLAEATRKGEELCVQLGNAMMRLHEAKEVLEWIADYVTPETNEALDIVVYRARAILEKWGKG